MLELKNDCLVFRFPEVHPDAVMTVTLHRTLRIPDDGKDYPLPPSLGAFPTRHVDDFSNRVPKKWVGRGGVMVPLYQSEALWLGFQTNYPCAVKVATGKCSAITGKPWSKKLREKDYLVCPEQPWLDGYVIEDGTVRQFVAAPLGLGVTAEEQITGKAEFGGLQIEVIPMSREAFDKKNPHGILRGLTVQSFGGGGKFPFCGLPGVYSSVVTNNSFSGDLLEAKTNFSLRSKISASSATKTLESQNYVCNTITMLSDAEARTKRPEMYADALIGATMSMDSMEDLSRGVSEEVGAQIDMGLAPGGRMKQQVFEDPHGLDVWHKTEKSRCFVHMANSLGWEQVTGQKPPTTPISAAMYTAKGYPWFEYYEEKVSSHSGTDKTKNLKSVAEFTKEKKIPILPENQSTDPKNKIKLKKHPNAVRDGVWK